MSLGHVYYIKCKANNKIYIGSTTRLNANSRFSEHKYRLKKGSHANKHLQSSWDLYKKESFEFGIIESCDPSKVFLLEWHYVNITRSYDKHIGFNKSKVVEAPNRGVKMSEETKRLISKKLKGKVSPNKGKKLPYARANIQKANKAQWRKVVNRCTGEVFPNVKVFCEKNKVNTTSFYKYVGKGYFKGIYFEYYKGQEQENLPIRLGYKKPKKVRGRMVINETNGRVYNSIKEAAEMNRLNRRKLNDCVLGKTETYGGFKWRYV